MKHITHLLIGISLFSFAFAEPDNALEDDGDDFLIESELQEMATDIKDADLEEDEFFTNLEQAAKTAEPVKAKEGPIAAPVAPSVASPVAAKAAPVAQPQAPSASQAAPAEIASKTPAPIQVAAPAPKKENVVKQPQKMEKAIPPKTSAVQVNFDQVFSGSPVIYSLLFLLSIASVFIWLYAQMSIRSVRTTTKDMTASLRNHLTTNQYDEALSFCQKQNNFFCRMVASGILSRSHGLHAITDVMKAEGKRATIGYWQKIALLNDIAIIAPMIGLLGTVLGMFYAFYDLNRSMESIAGLFDGLGVSVGTTVAGLVVAILAMLLHSLSKYRLTRALTGLENEAYSLATLIDQRTFLPK